MQEVIRLSLEEVEWMRSLNRLFADTFEDDDGYINHAPCDTYIRNRLSDPNTIVLASIDEDILTGGLVAYVLHKLEQERAEIYIYDLAVAESYRRQGIATKLIESLQPIAREIGAWVIYVQADYVDPPAIALYEKLGHREEVLHFDIPVKAK